ncbi:ABC transporter substrate-binding protein [Paracoccus jeotgali]|uniref:ABC transporter permease n=1 Tax=Paracoccus jeotgali TaxID=2065379 RepID=A0A2K9MJE7_9RHOB|nr:ABC transporter substrate-binding protein [Paracoccus jeotgali]AUM75743.1 ABC transporter permease [Paracoccus jeotgali]
MSVNSTKKVRTALLLSFLVGALPAPGSAEGLSDNVVKIAVLNDMTGVYSDSNGESALLAARMAIKDFGGTVLGKKIELVNADHHNKPDLAATTARRWFDQEQVDAVFGLGNTAVHYAVANVAEEKHKVIFNTQAASSSITGENCSPLVVHYTYDTYALAKGTVTSILESGGKSWYVIAADYTFGETLKNDVTEFVEQGGGKVIGSTKHPLNASDFSSYVLTAQASGADVVAFANAGADTVNLMRTAQEFGVTQTQTVAAMLLTINDIHAMGLETAQGLNATTGFYWDRTDETRAWSEKFYDQLQQMPNMLDAGTYSAIGTYLKAVERAGSDDPDAVMTALRAEPINDIFATNGIIRKDGRMVHDMYQFEVKSPAESKSSWDYYKIVSTVPGDVAFRDMASGGCPLVK